MLINIFSIKDIFYPKNLALRLSVNCSNYLSKLHLVEIRDNRLDSWI